MARTWGIWCVCDHPFLFFKTKFKEHKGFFRDTPEPMCQGKAADGLYGRPLSTFLIVRAHQGLQKFVLRYGFPQAVFLFLLFACGKNQA